MENIKKFPNIKFNKALKNIYFKYILRQDPYSIKAVAQLLIKFKTRRYGALG